VILDKTHQRWCIGTLSSLAVLTLGYVAYVTMARNEPSGGSIPGLAFGILAFLLMVFAFLLGLRRRFPAARLGSGQWWLRGHLWLGGLTVPVVLFHSGFRFGGPLEQALMWSFVIVVATGVYGLLIQQFLPRLIRHAIPSETFVDQIPYVCQRNLILCDFEVSRNTSPLAVTNDATIDQFGPIVMSTRKMLQVKDERKKNKAKGEGDEKGAISENWLDHVPSGLRELFRSLAQYAKDHNWPISKDGGTGNMRLLEEFPMSLPLIYKLKSVVDSAPPEPAPGGESPDGGNPRTGGPGPGPKAVAPQAKGKAPVMPSVAQRTPAGASAEAAVEGGKRVEGSDAPVAPPPMQSAAPAVGAGSEAPAKPQLSAGAAALQAKLAAKKAGGVAPAAVSAEPVAVAAVPATAEPAAPAAAAEAPAKPALSPAAAALQAKLAAKKAGGVAPATAPVELAAVVTAPATTEPAATAADAGSEAPAKPALSPAAAALQAKLAAKKAGGAAVPAEQVAVVAVPATAEPPAPAADTGSEAPAKPALSPAAAALQAKLAAKKAGGAAPASATAEPVAADAAPATPTADAGSEAPAKPALSPAAAALQAKLAAKKAGGAAPASAAPAAGSGTDAPAKPALSSGAAALQAKLAAKKAGAANPTAAPAEPPQMPPEAGVKTLLEAKPATVKSAALPLGGEKPARPLPKAPLGKPDAAGPAGGPAAAAKSAADEIPSHSRQRLLDFYLGQVRSFLIPDRKPRLSALANEDTGRSLFFQLRGELPAALHGTLNLMEYYCTERRQLLQLQRLHWQLHWWLGLHVPASAAVIVLMVIHAIVAARVIPFFN
jgi:hypothetical protein